MHSHKLLAQYIKESISYYENIESQYPLNEGIGDTVKNLALAGTALGVGALGANAITNNDANVKHQPTSRVSAPSQRVIKSVIQDPAAQKKLAKLGISMSNPIPGYVRLVGPSGNPVMLEEGELNEFLERPDKLTLKYLGVNH